MKVSTWPLAALIFGQFPLKKFDEPLPTNRKVIFCETFLRPCSVFPNEISINVRDVKLLHLCSRSIAHSASRLAWFNHQISEEPEIQPHLPLQGIRILDMSWLLPGPFATAILADLGAEVIKIEQPNGGDYMRSLSPELFAKVNVNKKSVVCDLKLPAGIELFRQLLETADVVVEGFRPGVTSRLGVDADSLSRIRKDLIHVAFTGYGQLGPMAQHSGHDINYLALAGALGIPGHWGEDARRSGLPVGDLAASLYGVINVLLALRKRDAGGGGSKIDLSIADSVLHWSNTRFGDYDPNASGEKWKHVKPGNDIFRTSDGRHVAFGIIEEKFWLNFCMAIERADLVPLFAAQLEDPSVGRHMRDSITQVIAGGSLAFWTQLFDGKDVPCSSVNMPSEALAEEQFASRSMVAEVHMANGSAVPIIGLPGSLFGRTHADPKALRPAPDLGADTTSILRDSH